MCAHGEMDSTFDAHLKARIDASCRTLRSGLQPILRDEVLDHVMRFCVATVEQRCCAFRAVFGVVLKDFSDMVVMTILRFAGPLGFCKR